MPPACSTRGKRQNFATAPSLSRLAPRVLRRPVRFLEPDGSAAFSIPDGRCGFEGGREGRPLSRAISSLRIWFSTRSAWFSARKASREPGSIESAGCRDILSVKHKTAHPRKPLSPGICPSCVEQGDRARAWDQLPHGRGPPRSDYGQDPGSPLFGAGALGSWCGSPAWDGPRRLICGLEGQANLSSDAARSFQVCPIVTAPC